MEVEAKILEAEKLKNLMLVGLYREGTLTMQIPARVVQDHSQTYTKL